MDEKTQKIVDREVKRAVKEDRKRITDALKDLKAEYAEDEDLDTKTRRAHNATISAAGKIVKDAA